MHALEAKIRTEDARATRENGLIPAVLYGKDVPSTKISVEISPFIKVYRETGKSQLITLTVDGKKYNTLVQEAQRHPVRGNFLHLDFINVDMKNKIEIQIPIVLIGTSPAILAGGQIHQVLMELTVKCLPKDIVESFELNVDTLDVGHVLRVADLKLDDTFEIINAEDEAIVSAHELKKAEEEEIPATEENTDEEATATQE